MLPSYPSVKPISKAMFMTKLDSFYRVMLEHHKIMVLGPWVTLLIVVYTFIITEDTSFFITIYDFS